ncbi:hypothetical protein C923_03294 [Plasmodium falciparum UGT5.1]|uniref:Uncharacterized protein n=1 Tax=Plasmodium falciparum UGT5.1 TaxID=1237627 RepID=W7JB65_PLAFA|nr:hypothetical protein C923_03294 [Plasmodium falciparum UGT5.1]
MNLKNLYNYNNITVEYKTLQYDNTMRDKKIHQVAKNLHHLVSTKTQKGVYNLKIENIIKEQQKKLKRKDKNYDKK